MDRVIGDDVATADVLWFAAERIGKSSNGDEIQKICDYLVNKHWFQTAADLRIAQLATEEWHSLQIPSRLKIAVQQVLDEVHYHQQPQGGSPYGYADYYPAAAQGDEDQHATWPSDQSTVAGYEGYYYSQKQQYETTDESANTASYPYGTKTTGASPTGGEDHRVDLYASNYYSQATSLTASEDMTDHVTSEDYYNYHHRHHAEDAYQEGDEAREVVEAHAVVVEDATTYEEILAPIPIQQWGCRQCTYLNPISESFCEMCHDHISASPDMTGVLIAGAPVAATAPKQAAQYSADAESGYPPPPAYVQHQGLGDGHAAATALPTQPMSPLYLPSAPSYDETMESDDENLPQVFETVLLPPVPTVAQVSTTSIPSDLVKQLAFQRGETSASSTCEIIHPTKVLLCPPQPTENYFALAFKGKAAGEPSNSPGGNGAAKSDRVRQEEDTLTEYSF